MNEAGLTSPLLTGMPPTREQVCTSLRDLLSFFCFYKFIDLLSRICFSVSKFRVISIYLSISSKFILIKYKTRSRLSNDPLKAK